MASVGDWVTVSLRGSAGIWRVITATIQLVSPDHLRRGDEFASTSFSVLDS